MKLKQKLVELFDGTRALFWVLTHDPDNCYKCGGQVVQASMTKNYCKECGRDQFGPDFKYAD